MRLFGYVIFYLYFCTLNYVMEDNEDYFISIWNTPGSH